MMELQVDLNDLKEFTKKRAQEDYLGRQNDRRELKNEIAAMKEAYEGLKKQSEKIIKERDNEIRVLQEKILSFDPDYLTTHSYKECSECKKKDSKLADAESRITELTVYI